MKSFWLKLTLIVFVFCAVISLASCGGSSKNTSAVQQEQKYTNQNQARVASDVPPPALTHSEERRNLSDRYTRLSDPNKIQYLYILGFQGNVVAHYTIKGKVSSVSSQITNTTQLICKYSGDSGVGCGTVDQAEPDGSYGTNGNGHFAFTTTGVYIEFDGPYIETDAPLTVQASPVLSVNANAKPTATNTSAIVNKRANDRTK